MTAPMNSGRYVGCFGNPLNRPSQRLFAAYADAQTRAAVQWLTDCWAEEESEADFNANKAGVVQGAEALLQAEGRRHGAQAEGWQAGEPGA